ncbi:MAG: YabP/YqfC family sporulation protein, partial [Oscillospiraceae bacterium]
EIFDGKSIVIQGTNGIISYESDEIKVSVNANEITFLGDNLSIKNLSSDSLEITGKIKAIEFES